MDEQTIITLLEGIKNDIHAVRDMLERMSYPTYYVSNGNVVKVALDEQGYLVRADEYDGSLGWTTARKHYPKYDPKYDYDDRFLFRHTEDE
jgi:hypothetical protein